MSLNAIDAATASEVGRQVRNLQLDDMAVFHALMERIRAGAPCAMIRLNDGEAKIVGYPKYFSRDVVDVQLQIWFGHSDIPDQDLLTLRADLLEGLRQPGVYLGLPRPDRLDARDADGRVARDAELSGVLWKTLFEEGVVHAETLCGGAAIHKWLHSSRKLVDLVETARHCVFVNRSIDAVCNVTKALGLKSFSFHGIPGESWSRFVSSHYPTRFFEVMDELAAEQRGAVGIIGAGVLGKLYCLQLYDAGCAALDMGAVFDGWAGDIPSERFRMVQANQDWSAAHLRVEPS